MSRAKTLLLLGVMMVRVVVQTIEGSLGKHTRKKMLHLTIRNNRRQVGTTGSFQHTLPKEGTMAVEWEERCIEIEKSKTGIDGLDQITGGGLPKRGATLVAGNVGCGKTLLAMQYLVNGALLENEPGVFLALEESNEELKRNFASIGIDIQSLIDRGLLTLLNVDIKQDFMEEPTKPDMGDWFIRLA